MGTYDTRGGSPLSPYVPDGDLHPLSEEVLEFLERKSVPSHINDVVIAKIEKHLNDLWNKLDKKGITYVNL